MIQRVSTHIAPLLRKMRKIQWKISNALTRNRVDSSHLELAKFTRGCRWSSFYPTRRGKSGGNQVEFSASLRNIGGVLDSTERRREKSVGFAHHSEFYHERISGDSFSASDAIYRVYPHRTVSLSLLARKIHRENASKLIHCQTQFSRSLQH